LPDGSIRFRWEEVEALVQHIPVADDARQDAVHV
jgi:hypothetical protein